MTSTPKVFNTGDTRQESGQHKKLNGVAACYGRETNISGYFLEQICDGAFSQVLGQKPDTRLLFNHDANHIFGRTTNQTLRLNEVRNVGLVFWVDLLENDPASDALFARILRRDITGCSFAFVVNVDDWTLPSNRQELPKRFILEIAELFDVGPVTYPAYVNTPVQAIYERQKTQSFEDFLEEENQDFDRRFKLTQLQKRIGLTFEQKFELGRMQRKTERLYNRLKNG